MTSTHPSLLSFLKPKGGYHERMKLVRGLKRASAADPDVLALRDRLAAQQGDAAAPQGFVLPHNILLTRDGFVLGLPGQTAETPYAYYRPLRAIRMPNIASASEVESQIMQRVHAYAQDAGAPSASAGEPYTTLQRQQLHQIVTAPFRATLSAACKFAAQFGAAKK